MNNQGGYFLNNILIPVWSLYDWVWLGGGKKQVSCPTRDLGRGEGGRGWETNDDEDEYNHGDGNDDGNDYGDGDGDDCPESLGSTYAITTPVFCRAPM